MFMCKWYDKVSLNSIFGRYSLNGSGVRLRSEPVFLAISSLKQLRKLALEIEKHRLLTALQDR